MAELSDIKLNREFVERILAAIKNGKSLCATYRKQVGTTACFLEELQALEGFEQKALKRFPPKPIGRPHRDYVGGGPQLIDLTRRDEQRRFLERHRDQFKQELSACEGFPGYVGVPVGLTSR